MKSDRHTSQSPHNVALLSLDDVLPLRRDVLRKGMLAAPAGYEEDDDPSTRHFGVRVGRDVVACSTWILRPFPPSPHEHAMQLKGMAVSEHLQGTGVGREVLLAGIEHARRSECVLVWARARNSAMGFYERNGFVVVGEEFIDATTSLPHHLVLLRV